MIDQTVIAENVEQFNGFAEDYDRYRPAVPPVIVDILTQLARIVRPKRVVDIGSGTGLSTRVWAERADEVVGIEPGDDMRLQAEKSSATIANVRYQKGDSAATGLPDNCADIVTISQALHWMEPTSTFAEIARLLRSGGVFAAIDNDFPAIVDWEAEAAEDAFMALGREVSVRYGYDPDARRKWRKDGHLERIKASGHFHYTREFAVHHVETGSADRMVGLTLSQASIQWMIKHGISADEMGLTKYRAEAHRILGDGQCAFYFTYRVRIGVK
ncbi:MAG: class I SAM-dependent methyltransferase [Aggregatilineales bacterium]